MPSDHGPIQSCLLMKRSSGYLAKSLISSYSVAPYLSQRIHPTWLHQKPRLGEWMSLIGVRVAVVHAVVTGPPQRALLRGGRAAERHQELREPCHPVAAVREVPVVAGRDEEHPAEVRHEEEEHRGAA